MSSVIGRSQLKHLDEWNGMRRKNAEVLSAKLEEIPGVKPPEVAEGGEHVYHQYPMTYCAEEMDGLSREVYMAALQAEGVSVSAYVKKPIYLRKRYQEQDYFSGGGLPWSLGKREIKYQEGDCPVAEKRCAEEEMNIGSTGWYEDCSELMDQVSTAFRKLAENVGTLKEREEELLEKGK